MTNDPQLAGMLGPFDRFTVTGSYWPRRGWVVTLRHKHDREAFNCTYVVELEGLASDEVTTAVEAFLHAGCHRFSWDAEHNRCTPNP